MLTSNALVSQENFVLKASSVLQISYFEWCSNFDKILSSLKLQILSLNSATLQRKNKRKLYLLSLKMNSFAFLLLLFLTRTCQCISVVWRKSSFYSKISFGKISCESKCSLHFSPSLSIIHKIILEIFWR